MLNMSIFDMCLPCEDYYGGEIINGVTLNGKTICHIDVENLLNSDKTIHVNDSLIKDNFEHYPKRSKIYKHVSGLKQKKEKRRCV